MRTLIGPRVWIAWAGLSVFCCSSALADGLIRDGVGPISTGRGGTNLGFSDNAAVILDNPAGIMNFDDQHFVEVGVDTIITDLSYTDPENAVRGAIQPFEVPEIGIVRKSSDDRWALGLGLFAPAGFMATYHMTNPILGPDRYRSFGMFGKILPALSYRVTDRLSVGATLGVGISRVELEGPFFLQTGPFAGAPASFYLKSSGAALVWSTGLQYELSEQTTIGVAYNSEASFRLYGDLHANLLFPSPFGPVRVPVEFDARFTKTWPQSVGVGLKHAFNEFHRGSLDLIWYDWNRAFDNFGLRLSDPNNPLIAALLGSQINDTFALNWSDSLSVRVGYEFLPTDVDVLRLGYVFHDSPVPDATLNPYVDGVLEHAVSAGYSRRWETWGLHLAYQYSFGPRRFVGQSALAGNDFSNSSFKAQAHWIGVSLTCSY